MLAKYPRELRFKWYLWVEKHKFSVKETCRLFNISRKVYYYWYTRDRGLVKRNYCSKRPHPHLKLTLEVKQFIAKQKLKTNYGPLKMSLLIKKRAKY